MTNNKTLISSWNLLHWSDRKFDKSLASKQRNFEGYFGDAEEHLIRAQRALGSSGRGLRRPSSEKRLQSIFLSCFLHVRNCHSTSLGSTKICIPYLCEVVWRRALCFMLVWHDCGVTHIVIRSNAVQIVIQLNKPVTDIDCSHPAAELPGDPPTSLFQYTMLLICSVNWHQF